MIDGAIGANRDVCRPDDGKVAVHGDLATEVSSALECQSVAL